MEEEFGLYGGGRMSMKSLDLHSFDTELLYEVGDPPEKVALKGIDWSYKSDEKAILKRCARDH